MSPAPLSLPFLGGGGLRNWRERQQFTGNFVTFSTSSFGKLSERDRSSNDRCPSRRLAFSYCLIFFIAHKPWSIHAGHNGFPFSLDPLEQMRVGWSCPSMLSQDFLALLNIVTGACVSFDKNRALSLGSLFHALALLVFALLLCGICGILRQTLFHKLCILEFFEFQWRYVFENLLHAHIVNLDFADLQRVVNTSYVNYSPSDLGIPRRTIRRNHRQRFIIICAWLGSPSDWFLAFEFRANDDRYFDAGRWRHVGE
jgi:hypothetical protein